MSADLERHLGECRRRGLHVDEDFERGRAALRRAVRGVTLAILLATIIATTAAVVRPALAEALFAPVVTAKQSHWPDASRSHAPFKRTIVRARYPRAYA